MVTNTDELPSFWKRSNFILPRHFRNVEWKIWCLQIALVNKAPTNKIWHLEAFARKTCFALNTRIIMLLLWLYTGALCHELNSLLWARLLRTIKVLFPYTYLLSVQRTALVSFPSVFSTILSVKYGCTDVIWSPGQRHRIRILIQKLSTNQISS